MPAVGSGSFDEPVLEHERGDNLGALNVEKSEKLVGVNVLFEHGSRGVKLAL